MVWCVEKSKFVLMLKKISDFDNRVSVYWTNRHFSAKTTKFLKFYVRLGDGYIWALFIAFLIWKIGWAGACFACDEPFDL